MRILAITSCVRSTRPPLPACMRRPQVGATPNKLICAPGGSLQEPFRLASLIEKVFANHSLLMRHHVPIEPAEKLVRRRN